MLKRTGIVSRIEIQQCATATHKLESQGQELSEEWKHSKTATHRLKSQGQALSVG